ncbi:hypothetical protein Taro_026128, partial [Colocasia esculenta]|nr:hypothetical protein [Colocasia esculenta]
LVQCMWILSFEMLDRGGHPQEWSLMYEKQYMESKPKETSTSVAPTPGDKEAKLHSKSSTTEQDLDVFLLGDGSGDEGPGYWRSGWWQCRWR